MYALVTVASLGALAVAAASFVAVRRMPAGTPAMQEIAGAIREGADAFIHHEYRIIGLVALCVAAILGVVVAWYAGAAFVIGAVMSASAGFVGMKIATIANVRVSNAARESGSLGRTLRVAFQGGSVMGLSVAGFALLGLGIVYAVFGQLGGQLRPDELAIQYNWIGISFIPFAMTVSGYALGCSIIAMFDRVGGGIYTKAADMGADLVGKTEARIPEDDPRNPATIADNVGDNVGDVAGLGADLLESFVGAIISAVVLASYLYYTNKTSAAPVSAGLAVKLIVYPVAFAAAGTLSSIVGILSLVAKRRVSDRPHRELNFSTWASAALTLVSTAVVTFLMLRGEDLGGASFAAGLMSPWIAAVLGIVCGVLIGQIAEFYTSYDFGPTQRISRSSEQGTALVITTGMAAGMRSVLLPSAIIGMTIVVASAVAGIYGVAMAAIGMLSFVAATVSVDTYGPIADNAGGISEMSRLDPHVREITDTLDSVGNTTAAIGKGFAIGSAALAALSLFASYLYSQDRPGDTSGMQLVLNMIDTFTLAGAVVGAAIPYLFSGMLIDAVAAAARRMVSEVRRQFQENPAILTGEAKPDYQTCIRISSAGALSEMKVPALVAVLTPVVCGFVLGANFVGGLLIGATLSAIMLALYTANAGGAWDNGKKFIEHGHYGGKGSEAHAAAVIGDTVGDPLKDTVGPSLDILIKIMAVISLISVSVFGRYNLLRLLGW